jgi:hypothetical protein
MKRATDSISGKIKPGASRWATLACSAVLSTALWAGAQPALLSISGTNGTNIVLSWNTRGQLQSAPSPNGPWTTVQETAKVLSSLFTTWSGPIRFFRVVDNGVPGAAVPVLPTALPGDIGTGAVVTASIQLLSGGTINPGARLEVGFQPGLVASSNWVTMLVGNQLLTLNDQGVFPDRVANDGIFSASVAINTNDFDGMNTAISNLPPSARFSYVFDAHRHLIGTNPLVPFPKGTLLGGARIPIAANGMTACAGSPQAYQWNKTVTIIDLSVVQDLTRTWDPAPAGTGTKMGAWTFGRLVTDMVNTPMTGIDPADFVFNWLNTYKQTWIVAGDPVAAETNIDTVVIQPWLAASAANGLPPGKLDLTIAPFRLLAIVNRIDLHGNTATGLTYSGDPSALGGEGRFVFGVTDMQGNPLVFTVIFEYGIPKNTCPDLQGWAQQWAALDGIPFGPAYNSALQAITDQFATPNANPAHLNGSAINQVRANNGFNLVNPVTWTLREFRLSTLFSPPPPPANPNAGWLIEAPVKQTPAFSLNNTTTLEDFINLNHFELCGQSGIPVPGFFEGKLFNGGSAPVPAPGFFWTTPDPVPCCSRHGLSLNACNGCHAGETRTDFVHVRPRPQNAVSTLSQFLTGVTVVDPISACASVSPSPYRFQDLDRRVQELNRLATCPCLMDFATAPLNMTH